MARISRVRGPTVSFELTGALARIPGFVVERSFGSGVLLIGGHIRIFNGTAGVVQFRLVVVIDGVEVNASSIAQHITNAQDGTLTFFYLAPGVRGFHTVEVQVIGSGNAGDIVAQDSSEFCVIELPDWDDDSFLVTL